LWFGTTSNPYYDEFSIDRIEVFKLIERYNNVYKAPTRQRFSIPGEKLML
jgi:hypothetical protein